MKEEAGCFLLGAVIVKAWTSGGIDAAFLSVALKVAPDDFCHPGFFYAQPRAREKGRTFLKNQAGAKKLYAVF